MKRNHGTIRVMQASLFLTTSDKSLIAIIVTLS